MRREISIALTVLLAALGGCSSHTLDSKDLSSSLRATSSLAAEAGVFIEYLGSGHSTDAFARGHAEYLRQELDDERQDLQGARVSSSLRPSFDLCETQQEQLGRELRLLKLAIGQPDELADIARQIRAIGQAAAQAREGL
ncbi:MAG TPA: hypothetical protein VGM43_17240 [Bryobacteraceae bacterium]